jgi:hypothetical protein
MSARTQARHSWASQLRSALISVSLVLAGSVSCAPVRTSPVGQATPTPSAAPSATGQDSEPTALSPTATTGATVPSGWKTQTSQRFAYAISYPPDMDGTDNGDYSWTLGIKLANLDAGARNFIYVSAIPKGFQSGGGEIYNYNTPETEILLNLQVGESQSLREGLDTAQGFTYTRQPDTTISGHTAQTYENSQPWEFPQGTKEIRYYLQTDEYTYLIGGYMDTTGSNQPGAITEALFNQIVSTFRLIP